MFDFIRRKLSLKVSIALALITIPIVVAAAYFITAHETSNQEALVLNAAKVAAVTGATTYGQHLEAGIDDGLFTINDLITPVYEEIQGFDFGDNPRFHTRYDFYTDRMATPAQDRIVESSPDFLYAVAVDANGYLPTHNTKYSHALTGDRTKDLAGNRAKRKFTDPVGMAAAKNLEPTLLQEYHRDTGEVVWDVSSPVYVKGQHFGGFRVGVAVTTLVAHKRGLLIRLSAVFGLLCVVTVGFIFLVLRRSMKPLENLAAAANEISLGENIDRPIKLARKDEIGQMASSLNRLRASVKLAMGDAAE